MATTARYLIFEACTIRPTPGAPSVHTGAGATRNNPLPIEVDARVVPSRSWRPLNRAAQEALAAIGVDVAIVADPTSRPVRKEADTMLEMSERRSRPAHVQFTGPRLSDHHPLTGETRAAEPPRLTADREKE